MTAIGYYFGILCLLFTRASALKSLARLQSFSWKLFTTAPLHFENTRFINLYTYPSNFVKSITQTDAALMPSNYQITEQIWRHTCAETMIENSKNISWGRNLTYRHMYFWGCTGTALSKFCQPKISFTVRGEETFTLTFTVSRGFLC